MPDTEYPTIDKWVNFLSKRVGNPDEDTYFVGHSIGCQTIMRYLQTIDAKVGGVVFVAGFFTLKGLETDSEREIAAPWLKTPIDTKKVKRAAKSFTAFFSDNDQWVPLEDEKIFREKLGAKTIIKNKMGHFGNSDNLTEFPDVLTELLALAK